jgi:chromosome segregation ATPase
MNGFFSFFYKKDKLSSSESADQERKMLADNPDIVVDHEHNRQELTQRYINQIKAEKEIVCRLEEEIELLKSSLIRVGDANKHIRKELSNAISQLISLKSTAENETKRGETLKLLLADKSVEYDALNDELNSITAEKTKVSQECEQLKSELNLLREELRHTNKTHSQINKRMQLDLEKTSAELKRTNDDKDILEKQVKELREELQHNNEKCSQTQAELEKTSVELQSTKQLLIKTKGEKDALAQQIGMLRKENNRLSLGAAFRRN